MTTSSQITDSKPRPLVLTPRQHFFMDPVFSDCWHTMEKEIFHPFSKTVQDVLDGKYLETSITNVPWKWNNVGRMIELYSQKRPEMEKSLGVETHKHSYKMLLDVQHFRPEELSINVTDRTVVIKGKHEEKDDQDGTVSREFVRNYILPADVLMDKIECNLSSDGVLHIKAPRKLENDALPQVTPGEILHQMVEDETKDKNKKEIVEHLTRHVDKDETMASHIHALPDFDMVPFWSRDLPNIDSKFGVKSDKDSFKVVIDTGLYTPEGLSVHTTPHHVMVKATHEENKNAHGFMSRKFSRKYYIPQGVRPEEINCTLTSDGVLEIRAPKHQNLETEFDKPIPVPIMMKELPRTDNLLSMTVEDKHASIGDQPLGPAPAPSH